MTEQKDSGDQDWQVGLSDALSRLPGPNAERYAAVFKHGTLLVEIYAPQAIDPQQPHDRDEVYIVMRGNGEFVSATERRKFKPGDFLFVPAGVPHRFENFSTDFAVWVVFYGPEGGEG